MAFVPGFFGGYRAAVLRGPRPRRGIPVRAATGAPAPVGTLENYVSRATCMMSDVLGETEHSAVTLA